MIEVLTEVNVPRRMPTLNILPFEQPSERFNLSGHPGTSQLHFLLGEYPDKNDQSYHNIGNQKTNQLGFARAGSWGIAKAVQRAQGRETQPQTLLLLA
jgi:hypothetical protein